MPGGWDIPLRATFVAMGAVFGTFAARIPAVRDGAGLGEAALGTALLALMLGALLGLIPGAMLVARLGTRRVLVGAWVTFALTLALIPAATGLLALSVLLFVFAAANSVMDVSLNDQATGIERERARSMLAGFHAMHTMGTLVGAGVAVIAASLAIEVGAHFLAAAAMLLPFGIVGAVRSEEIQRWPGTGGELRLPGRTLLVPSVIALAVIFIDDVGNTWSAVYLTDVSGTGGGLASAGFGALTLGGLGGRLLADGIVERIGRVRFVQVAGLVAALGGALVVLLPHPATSLLGFGLVGLGAAGIFPVVLSQAAERNPDRRPEAIAGVTTVGYVGSLIGPFGVGLLSAGIGLRAAMLVIPLLAAGIVVLAMALRRG